MYVFAAPKESRCAWVCSPICPWTAFSLSWNVCASFALGEDVVAVGELLGHRGVLRVRQVRGRLRGRGDPLGVRLRLDGRGMQAVPGLPRVAGDPGQRRVERPGRHAARLHEAGHVLDGLGQEPEQPRVRADRLAGLVGALPEVRDRPGQLQGVVGGLQEPLRQRLQVLQQRRQHVQQVGEVVREQLDVGPGGVRHEPEELLPGLRPELPVNLAERDAERLAGGLRDRADVAQQPARRS